MLQLVSMGGQHQGVFGLPNCPSLSRKSCEQIRKLLNDGAYTGWMQNHLVQATYWHDPWNEKKYKQHSSFLADINNERSINQTYIDNLQALKRFVFFFSIFDFISNNFTHRLILVKFTQDTIVQPKDTEWFEFYEPGQDTFIVPLKDSDIYLQDRLGLKQMVDNSQIIFVECEGNHLQFTDDWFREKILPLLLMY